MTPEITRVPRQVTSIAAYVNCAGPSDTECVHGSWLLIDWTVDCVDGRGERGGGEGEITQRVRNPAFALFPCTSRKTVGVQETRRKRWLCEFRERWKELGGRETVSKKVRSIGLCAFFSNEVHEKGHAQ